MVVSVMGVRPAISLASTFGTAGGIGTARRGGRAGSSATSGPTSRSVCPLAADLGSQVVEDVAGGALLRVCFLPSRLAGLGLLLGLGQGSVDVGEIRFCLWLRDASVRGTTATSTTNWRGLLGRGSPGIGGARGVGVGLGRTGISLLDCSVLVSRSRTGLLVRSRGGTRSAASSRRTRQVVCLDGRGGLSGGSDVILGAGRRAAGTSTTIPRPRCGATSSTTGWGRFFGHIGAGLVGGGAGRFGFLATQITI